MLCQERSCPMRVSFWRVETSATVYLFYFHRALQELIKCLVNTGSSRFKKSPKSDQDVRLLLPSNVCLAAFANSSSSASSETALWGLAGTLCPRNDAVCERQVWENTDFTFRQVVQMGSNVPMFTKASGPPLSCYVLWDSSTGSSAEKSWGMSSCDEKTPVTALMFGGLQLRTWVQLVCKGNMIEPVCILRGWRARRTSLEPGRLGTSACAGLDSCVSLICLCVWDKRSSLKMPLWTNWGEQHKWKEFHLRPCHANLPDCWQVSWETSRSQVPLGSCPCSRPYWQF